MSRFYDVVTAALPFMLGWYVAPWVWRWRRDAKIEDARSREFLKRMKREHPEMF